MKKSYLYLAIISIAGTLALGLVTYPYGVGVTPDSVNYLSAARNFADGSGLFTNVIRWNSRYEAIPLIYWPPFFSLVVAGFYKLGFSLTGIPWLLNLVLFGLNSYLTGFFILKTSDSKIAGGLGYLIFMIVYPSYLIHSQAWSEPLFITLYLGAFYFLERYLDNDSRSGLVISGLLAGLSWVTRYAGITVAAGALTIILFFNRRNWGEKIKAAFVYGIISIIPIALWGYRNYRLLGTPIIKAVPRISQKAAGFPNLILMIQTIAGWFSPYYPPALAVILLLGVLLVCLSPLIRPGTRNIYNKRVLQSLLTFLVVYLTFMIISCYLMRFALATRFLSVILPPLLIVVILSLMGNTAVASLKLSRPTLSLMLVLLLSPMLIKAANWGNQVFTEGNSGYSTKVWRESETIKWLNKYQQDRVLFSNGNDALVLLTKYRARDLPIQKEKQRLARFWDTVRHFNGLIVYLDNIKRPHHISEAELAASGRITQVFSFSDGRLYELKY